MQHSGRFTCPAALVDNSIKFDVFKIGIEMLKRIFLVGLASLGVWSSCVVGQSGTTTQWPTQPVRVIVPFPGGASTLDAVVRLLVPEVARDLAGSVFVENKPGAANTLAADFTAKSPKDGYTLLVATNTGQAIAPHLLKLAFDPMKDLQPIGMVVVVPHLLLVGPNEKAKDIKELVSAMKNIDHQFRHPF